MSTLNCSTFTYDNKTWDKEVFKKRLIDDSSFFKKVMSDLTPFQRNEVFGSEEEKFKFIQTNNLTSQEVEDKITGAKGVIQGSKDIVLHDLVKLPSGQIREHAYGEGQRFADGSVTSWVVEDALKRYKSALPQNDYKLAAAQLASESGTKIHNKIEEIWHDILDKDGRLLPQDKWTENHKVDFKDDVSMYVITGVLKNFVTGLARSFPEGTRFFPEQKMIDWKKTHKEVDPENSKKLVEKTGMGASIDLLVVTPDTVAHIFDYKTTSDLALKKQVPDWKITAINAQLSEYRGMLKRLYGITNFGKIRAIPMDVVYVKIKDKDVMSSLDIGDVSGINEHVPWLNHIAIDSEFVRDVKLKNFTERLKGLEDELKEIKTVDIIKQQHLSEQIKNLHEARQTLILLSEGSDLEKQVSKLLDFANELFLSAKRDLTNLSDSDRHKLYTQLEVFSGIEDTFNDQLEKLEDISRDKTQTKEDREYALYLRTKLTDFSRMVRRDLIKFKDRSKNIADNLLKETLNIDPNKVEKKVGFISEFLTVMSKIPIATLQVFHKLYAERSTEAQRNITTWKNKINKVYTDFIKFSGAKSGGEYFKNIEKYFFEDNKQVNVYSKDFWERVNKARANKDVEEIKKLFNFDKESYDKKYAEYKENIDKSAEVFTERITEIKESLKEIEDKVNELKSQSTAPITTDPRYLSLLSEMSNQLKLKSEVEKSINNLYKRLDSFRSKYFTETEDVYGNIIDNQKAWFNESSMFLRGKDEFKSDKFKVIEKTPELKAVWDLMHEVTNTAEKYGVLNNSGTKRKFVTEFIEASDDERAARGLKRETNAFKKLLVTPEEEEEIVAIKNKTTGDYKKEIKKPGSSVASTPTRDIFEALMNYTKSLESYKLKKDLEGVSLDLLEKEKSKNITIPNKFGHVLRTIEGEIPEVKDKTNAELFEYFVDKLIYSKDSHVFDKAIAVPFTDKKVSLERMLVGAMRVFSAGRLSNLPSIWSNLFGTGAFTWISAKQGDSYNQKQLTTGISKLVTRDSKMMHLLEHFYTESGFSHIVEKQDFTGIPYFNRFGLSSIEDLATSGIRLGDKNAGAWITSAHLMSSMFDKDGKFWYIRDYLLSQPEYKKMFDKDTDSKTVGELSDKLDKDIAEYSENHSIYKATSLIKKGDVNEIQFTNTFTGKSFDPFEKNEGSVQSEGTRFQEAIKREKAQVTGAIYQDNPTGTDKTWALKLVTQFRKWMFEMVSRAYSSPNYNTDTNKLDYGFINYFTAQFTKDRFVPMLQMVMGQLHGGGFTSSMLEAARSNYESLKLKAIKDGNNFDMDGNPYNTTFEQFADRHRTLLRGSFRYISGILATVVALNALKMLTADDKDESMYRDEYTSRYLQKAYNELSFYYDPRELYQITSNSLPVMGLIMNVIKIFSNSYEYTLAQFNGDEESMNKAHPGKYFFKLFPFGSLSLDTIAFFDDDFRQEWSIKQRPIGF